MHFAILYPVALWLLPFVACFFICKPLAKTFYLSRWEWLPHRKLPIRLIPLLPPLIFILLVFSASTPYLYKHQALYDKKGRALVLALDVSGSMGQSGFDAQHPHKSKFDTLIAMAKHFTRKRYDDNIGIVAFGSFAYGASPLTYDMHALRFLLGTLSVGLAGESTAIAEAIVRALELLKPSRANKKVIVLITDGFHNAGRVSINEALKKATTKNVRIYTIGIGTPANYDKSLLETIAEKSGGKHFGARNAEALEAVFETIEKLEPSPIASGLQSDKILLSPYLLVVALVLIFWLFKQEGTKR